MFGPVCQRSASAVCNSAPVYLSTQGTQGAGAAVGQFPDSGTRKTKEVEFRNLWREPGEGWPRGRDARETIKYGVRIVGSGPCASCSIETAKCTCSWTQADPVGRRGVLAGGSFDGVLVYCGDPARRCILPFINFISQPRAAQLAKESPCLSLSLADGTII